MRLAALALAIALPSTAFAVGEWDDDPAPAAPEPAPNCIAVEVLDTDANTCIALGLSLANDDERLTAAQAMAYHGRTDDALAVLDTLTDPDTSEAQTLFGYTHRRAGQLDQSMVHYDRALALDPDNIQARSYMGQTLILLGDTVGALTQLREIDARSGKGTWAYTSLDGALRGLDTDY